MRIRFQNTRQTIYYMYTISDGRSKRVEFNLKNQSKRFIGKTRFETFRIK